MELDRQKVEEAFARLLSKNRDKDPITLAEKLTDRLIALYEDSDGSTDMPPLEFTSGDQRERGEVPHRRAPVQPMRKETGVKPPPVAPSGASSMIAMPGDPEFEQAERALGKPQDLRSAGRVSNLGQSKQAAMSDTIYWDLPDLIKSLEEKTPAQFTFIPLGCDESVKVLARRNIQSQIMTVGPHLVRLEYSNPGVADDYSTVDASGQLDEVKIGLKATHMFSCNMQELDIERAMDLIERQLQGLYAPRSESMEPEGRDPGPIQNMFSMTDPKRRTPMGQAVRIEGAPGWRMALNPQGDVMDSVIKQNSRYGGPGSRT